MKQRDRRKRRKAGTAQGSDRPEIAPTRTRGWLRARAALIGAVVAVLVLAFGAWTIFRSEEKPPVERPQPGAPSALTGATADTGLPPGHPPVNPPAHAAKKGQPDGFLDAFKEPDGKAEGEAGGAALADEELEKQFQALADVSDKLNALKERASVPGALAGEKA